MVGIFDGGQAVSDDQGCAIAHQAVQRVLYQGLRLVIK